MSGDPWTDAQVAELKPGLLELMREIHSGRLTVALEVTKGHSLDETRHVEIQTSKAGHTDPVASQLDDDGNVRQRDLEHALLLSLMETVGQATNDLVAKVRKNQPQSGPEAHARYKKEFQAVLSLRPCACIGCEDQVPLNPEGDDDKHCEACAEYLKARPGVKQVPSAVLAARLRKRKQREAGRLHITGPLKEEIA